MCSYIREDWRRYVALFRPASPDIAPNSLRVLLSSSGLFVVGYRIVFWLRTRHEKTESCLFRVLLKVVNPLATSFAVYSLKTQFSHWSIIGPGLYLSNKRGVIIGAMSLGADCTIHHNVPLAPRRLGTEDVL
jgi:serine acetyltransferase